MSDVIGRGVIEVSADSTKLKAGIDDAKRSIKSLGGDISSGIGTASKSASASIDRYVRSLQTQAATQGRSARETELYKLALRGASEAQLGAANSALRLAEGYQRGQVVGEQLRAGFIAIAAAASLAGLAAAAGTIALINQVGKYQDLSDKIGDTASNISSLKTASDVTGTSLDTIASASVRLTASLSKTDDESKTVGAAITALGLDFQKFKAQSPVEQLQAVAGAMEGFADGSEKTAVAVALFGKSGAELLGFLKEYGGQGLKAAYVTEEQAKAADDFSDASARLRSEFQQFLQLSATSIIPVLLQVGDVFRTISEEEQSTSLATRAVQGAIAGLVTVFQVVATVGANVSFVLKTVGNDLGAIAAGYAALARLDLQGFNAISKAVKEDDARARVVLDKLEQRIMAVGQPTVSITTADLARRGRLPNSLNTGRPKLDTSSLVRDAAPKGPKGARGGVDNSATQEAKAQLAFDLDEIRKAQDALSNTIANDEKLLEARRSASLVSESAYYTQKRDNIKANDAIAEFYAQAEIERRTRELLTGKDKIDNDRKIADAQAKLVKIRENASASLSVLGIQEQAALDQVARAFEDARIAAQAYLDVSNRTLSAELGGMGQGNRARDQAAAISQITDRYEQQRQALQRDNRNGKFAGRQGDYDRELALLNEFQGKSIASYSAYYAALNEKQSSFALGVSESLRNYIDESANSFNLAEEAVTRAFQGMEDALVNFTLTGKLEVKSLVQSIIADLARIAVKQQITAPLAQLFASGASSGGDSGGTGWFGALLGYLSSSSSPRATGGPVSAGGLYRINETGKSEVLNVAGKQYLMAGENGTVMPAGAGGGARPINLSQTFVVDQPASRATQAQVMTNAGRGVQRALARGNA